MTGLLSNGLGAIFWLGGVVGAMPAGPTLVPEAPAAASFEPPQGPAEPPVDLESLWTALNRGLGRGPQDLLRWDERLAHVARDVASSPWQGTSPLGYRYLDFSRVYHGVYEPTPHVLFLTAGRDQRSELISGAVRAALDLPDPSAYSNVGAAWGSRGEDRQALVIVFLSSRMRLDRVPREAQRGVSFEVGGTLSPGYHDAHVVLAEEHRQGAGVEDSLVEKGTFTARVTCPAVPATVHVEVLAQSEAGVSVLANFPVCCGCGIPDRFVWQESETAPDPETVGEAERLLLEALNAERAQRGLEPLALDPALSVVARDYAEEMARTGRVAHISASGRSPGDRLRRFGLVRAIVRENLARAFSVTQAHESLMGSPGHRANILSEDVTHAGIGVAFGPKRGAERDLLVCELLVRLPEPVDERAVKARLAGEVRERFGLNGDQMLDQLARRLAEQMVEKAARGEALRLVSHDLDPASGRFVELGATLRVSSDLSGVDLAPLAALPKVTRVGIGVSQGAHPSVGPNAIFLVVISGRPARP